jgi:hypothetical protein
LAAVETEIDIDGLTLKPATVCSWIAAADLGRAPSYSFSSVRWGAVARRRFALAE